MSAKERKPKSAKERKRAQRAQKNANERFCIKSQTTRICNTLKKSFFPGDFRGRELKITKKYSQGVTLS